MARINGTAAATSAPKATSKMMNVSGIVSRRDPSRSLLMTSLISWLARVLLRVWISSPGFSDRI